MQAVYLSAGHIAYQADYPIPQPLLDEALIQVRLAGICATDLELVQGYASFRGVLGHEFVGVVVQASDSVWNGRRVVGSINIGCGHCLSCRRDNPEHCVSRQAMGIHGRDGAFADYLTLPVANLFPVPDSIPDEAAVFTEPLAAALRIREQIVVRPAGTTAVIGPGRLGLLVGQVLALAGTDVVMLGRQPSSLALPAQLGLRTALVDSLPAASFDVVVEVTGNEGGFAHAVRLVRPQGTIVLKSTFHGLAQANLTPIVVNEIRLIGSRCGPFAPALRLLAQTAVAVQPLIDGDYALQDAAAALAHAARPGVRKILLRPFS